MLKKITPLYSTTVDVLQRSSKQFILTCNSTYSFMIIIKLSKKKVQKLKIKLQLFKQRKNPR